MTVIQEQQRLARERREFLWTSFACAALAGRDESRWDLAISAVAYRAAEIADAMMGEYDAYRQRVEQGATR